MDAMVSGGATTYYVEYDSLGNWVDEFRFIEIDYKDTLVLGEEAKFEIKIHGPEVTGNDTNIVFFWDIYAQNPKVKSGYQNYDKNRTNGDKSKVTPGGN